MGSGFKPVVQALIPKIASAPNSLLAGRFVAPHAQSFALVVQKREHLSLGDGALHAARVMVTYVIRVTTGKVVP